MNQDQHDKPVCPSLGPDVFEQLLTLMMFFNCTLAPLQHLPFTVLSDLLVLKSSSHKTVNLSSVEFSRLQHLSDNSAGHSESSEVWIAPTKSQLMNTNLIFKLQGREIALTTSNSGFKIFRAETKVRRRPTVSGCRWTRRGRRQWQYRTYITSSLQATRKGLNCEKVSFTFFGWCIFSFINVESQNDQISKKVHEFICELA